MSAECQRCGWDLPYDGDCVVCDENGTFCNQLADALEAQGKLDAVAALRWRIYVIEAYIANGGHPGLQSVALSRYITGHALAHL